MPYIEDLAGLQDEAAQDEAALAAHLADKEAGREGVLLEDLDDALDKIDAAGRS